jgi:hypothetical protein
MILQDRIFEEMRTATIAAWELSGHSLSGAFVGSIEKRVETNPRGFRVDLLAYAYGGYLSAGVPADRVPFTPTRRGQPRGGTSKYIQGLVNFVKRRLSITDEREALGVAFAIAHKHKKTGYPVRDGQVGSRWISKISTEFDDRIEKEILTFYDKEVLKLWQ